MGAEKGKAAISAFQLCGQALGDMPGMLTTEWHWF